MVVLHYLIREYINEAEEMNVTSYFPFSTSKFVIALDFQILTNILYVYTLKQIYMFISKIHFGTKVVLYFILTSHTVLAVNQKIVYVLSTPKNFILSV